MSPGVGSTEPGGSGGADTRGAAAGTPWDGLAGLRDVVEKHGETTLVVDVGSLIDAATALRDDHGFNMLADLTPVDYLGWGERDVSGYIGTASGRDINAPMTQGYQVVPLAKPARFAVNYHLLSVSDRPRRIRLQTWVEDGQPVPTVVYVWPTADWHEREAFDMMGIEFEGHPNLRRILLDDDWEGHPLRKDYPVGGEPVRFSGEA